MYVRSGTIRWELYLYTDLGCPTTSKEESQGLIVPLVLFIAYLYELLLNSGTR